MVYKNREVITLENGLRVAMLPLQSTRLVHCGLMINAGSRDEEAVNNGVAHLIEHTVFKETKKRRSFHILDRIESVGGELNAYTSREKTCYYISCLRDYTGRALELLSDITFNATFPEKAIEKEKKVILEELEMYRDSPEDAISDRFIEKMFPQHPLGYDILGTPDTLKNLNRESILTFLGNHYAPHNMVLSIAGNISISRMKYYATKYFSNPFPASSQPERNTPDPDIPFNETETKDFMQQHAMIGGRGPDRHDQKKYAMLLINNILGGSGMSSRLNMEIREKRGYAYNVWSHYSAFADCGMFSVYVGTEGAYLEKSIRLVKNEFKRLGDKPLGIRQLSKAKKQVMGHIAMIQENYPAIMQSMAKNLLDYEQVISLDDFFAQIDQVSPEEIRETAGQYLDPEKVSVLRFINQSNS